MTYEDLHLFDISQIKNVIVLRNIILFSNVQIEEFVSFKLVNSVKKRIKMNVCANLFFEESLYMYLNYEILRMYN